MSLGNDRDNTSTAREQDSYLKLWHWAFTRDISLSCQRGRGRGRGRLEHFLDLDFSTVEIFRRYGNVTLSWHKAVSVPDTESSADVFFHYASLHSFTATQAEGFHVFWFCSVHSLHPEGETTRRAGVCFLASMGNLAGKQAGGSSWGAAVSLDYDSENTLCVFTVKDLHHNSSFWERQHVVCQSVFSCRCRRCMFFHYSLLVCLCPEAVTVQTVGNRFLARRGASLLGNTALRFSCDTGNLLTYQQCEKLQETGFISFMAKINDCLCSKIKQQNHIAQKCPDATVFWSNKVTTSLLILFLLVCCCIFEFNAKSNA